MALDDVPYPQSIGNSSTVPELEILLESVTTSRHVIRTGMNVASISDRLLESVDVERCDTLGICENFRNSFRDSDFVDTQIRVGRDDSTTREVDTFPRQIASETALFAL